MAKRRTRKEKQTARHDYQVNWDGLNLKNDKNSRLTEADVNRQKENAVKLKSASKISIKKADSMEKDASLSIIKVDLVKSILISIFIIAIELVLYFSWV